ncbi:MAG: MalY/PatB family protein [Betaproteobacteria bacterium]
MKFDFDTPIDRRGTGSLKWDKYKGRDVIPLWVADMDFACPPAVVEALRRRVDHPIYGYSDPPAELAATVVAYLQREHGWTIEPDWIVWLPGLVVGLNVVCRAFGEPGDDVLTATPVYPPFLSAPIHSTRNVVRVPMAEKKGIWRWDVPALERAITANSRLLLLCNPHNPVGRVFSRDELQAIAGVCERHDLMLCSDEIHCGLILDPEKPHVPVASLSENIAQRTVTLMSASKTFNLPALGCAYAIASNPEVRARIRIAMAGIVHHVGIMGFFATLAAYRDGRQWQLALLDYLRANRDLVEHEISRIPALRIFHAEATYLSWIDARALPIDSAAAFFEGAGVGLYDGAPFSAPGFLRLNFACPRSLLKQALDRISRSIANL